MSKFDLITERFGELPYMRPAEAEVIRSIITANEARDILELGFFQGKSTAYMAAILEDLGEGHISTFDLEKARNHSPNIEAVLNETELSHRVTPFFCKRSYTWELQRLISAPDRPLFDFCYFDGGHTWDLTGFGVLLVDMLLRPGGLILLDDMNWSIGRSPYYKKNPQQATKFDADEVQAKPVRLVWETILPHLGYEHVREYPEHNWALARKPF